MHLRPDLYRRLNWIKRLGGVQVAHEGEEMSSSIETYKGRPSLQVSHRGEAYRVNCPFCSDTRHRLWINHCWALYDPDTNTRNLWLCVCYNENCLATYERQRALYNMIYDDTVPMEKEGDILVRGEKISSQLEAVTMPGEVIPLDALPADHAAIGYLRSRNFDTNLLTEKLGVGYCTVPQPAYRMAQDRIVIPFYMRGLLVGWQTRYIGNPPAKRIPKYWTMPGMKKSRILYNFDLACKYPYVVVMEGPTDVWRFGPEAVALLGRKTSTIQNKLLVASWRQIIIVMDGDAYEEAVAIQDDLSHYRTTGIQVSVVTMPADKDPGDFDTWTLRAMILGSPTHC